MLTGTDYIIAEAHKPTQRGYAVRALAESVYTHESRGDMPTADSDRRSLGELIGGWDDDSRPLFRREHVVEAGRRLWQEAQAARSA